MQYCSLQHWTLLLSPVTSTTGCCFCFGPIPSFFLELFLHWSPVAYWAPTDLGSSSFSILSFLSFHTVHGVLKVRILKWFAIPFSSRPHSVKPLHHDPPILGCPAGMAWFHWVRQSIWPSNPPAGHTLCGNQNWKRHVYPNVHCSTVYNSQDMAATWMSISRWMDKKAVVHIHNGVLLSHKKEFIWISFNEVDETGADYTEWSKPERKTPIQYTNTYIWNLERW